MKDPTDREVRVLIVDDEVRGLELLEQTLRRFGPIEGAPSADRAWEMFEAGSYDLVVSDQRMPGMSGVELLSRVAEARPTCGRILVTGYTDLDSTIEAINTGRVHAYVAKPCNPRDLRLCVRGVLDRVLLEAENARLLERLTEQNTALERTVAQLEEAQGRVVRAEQLAAVGRTVAMILHDLRGPVSVLEANGALLAEGAATLESAEIEAVSREILEEARGLERLCALLQETGPSHARSDRAPGHVGDVAAAAAGVVAEAAGRQGVRIEQRLEDGEAEIRIDRGALRRALVNLLYNAIEALPDGGTIVLETACDDAAVRVRVTDDGPGVPEAIAGRLFEPFETHGKAHGTGLGLAVVRQVAEDHGGRVVHDKPEGGGAAFTLVLPRD